LPHGAAGVPTMPDDLEPTPREALEEAQRLLDADRPFHAHEVLEAAWKSAPEAERELWRGLAQVAVGLTHIRRGNPRGARALLTRAADRLDAYAAAPPHHIDVAGIAAASRRLAERSADPDLATAPLKLTLRAPR
jgi:predicted metal-dependent hydrolase